MKDEMGFDLLVLARADFHSSIKMMVGVHDAARSNLKELLKTHRASLDRDIAAMTVPEKRDEALQFRDMEEISAKEQERIFGYCWLFCVVSLLEMELKKLKSLFDETPTCNRHYGKKGDSWLVKMSVEYSARFGVDLQRDYKDFAFLKEINLARNCAVHEGGVVSAEIVKHFPNSNYIDEDDLQRRIYFSEQHFKEATQQIDAFAKWLIKKPSGIWSLDSFNVTEHNHGLEQP